MYQRKAWFDGEAICFMDRGQTVKDAEGIEALSNLLALIDNKAGGSLLGQNEIEDYRKAIKDFCRNKRKEDRASVGMEPKAE